MVLAKAAFFQTVQRSLHFIPSTCECSLFYVIFYSHIFHSWLSLCVTWTRINAHSHFLFNSLWLKFTIIFMIMDFLFSFQFNVYLIDAKYNLFTFVVNTLPFCSCCSFYLAKKIKKRLFVAFFLTIKDIKITFF